MSITNENVMFSSKTYECGHETIVEPARYKIPEKYQCEDCGAWTDDLFRDSWVKIQEQGSDPVYFCWLCYEKRDRQGG